MPTIHLHSQYSFTSQILHELRLMVQIHTVTHLNIHSTNVILGAVKLDSVEFHL